MEAYGQCRIATKYVKTDNFDAHYFSLEEYGFERVESAAGGLTYSWLNEYRDVKTLKTKKLFGVLEGGGIRPLTEWEISCLEDWSLEVDVYLYKWEYEGKRGLRAEVVVCKKRNYDTVKLPTTE
jgi:hypothetical protein